MRQHPTVGSPHAKALRHPVRTKEDIELFSIPEPNTGCWLWLRGLMTTGYGAVGRHWPAHRLSYELYKGPIPDGMYILHSCDQRSCVNPDHLRAGTQAENIADMYRRGRHTIRQPVGQDSPTAKLTDEQVRAIRLDTRVSRVIGKQYGVHKETILAIKQRRRWSHLS